MPVPSAVPVVFPAQRHSLTNWLRKSGDEHRTIIRVVAAREIAALATYFREVHWSYERNQRYITAFDRGAEAAAHLS